MRKKFHESYDFLPRYFQRTTRLTWKISDLLKNSFSLKSVAEMTNVSVSTVCRILDCINYSCPPLKEAVSIDEFKGNAKTGKYQCIPVNPINSSIIDVLPNRSQSHLGEVFPLYESFSKNDSKIFYLRYIPPYVDLAHRFFPNSKVCVDKYHFIRHIICDIKNVRNHLRKTT